MKIELFTEVNFRGPTAKNGKCIALVECETKKGPAVKAQIETEQNTTYHRMSMIAILVGLRMLRPCEVTVYTPDQFLVTTINEGNMDKWKREEWRRPHGKELYYLEGWNGIDVVEKLPKSEKVETEWDRQRKKIKQLKALQKKINERKKEFIKLIADGKIELLKDEERQKIIEKMIRLMMEKSCWLGNGMVLRFFTGKSLYDADEKEKEEAEEKIQTLDTQVLLLIAMNNMMDDYTGDLVEYSGEYKEDAGKRYQECFKILMRYGWSYEREEADLVYGNHELYKKES